MLEGELVACLVLAVGLVVLLNGIVGEVDVEVVQRLLSSGVRFGGGAQVAFFEEVHPSVLINEHPYSDVELPAVNEHWPLEVLLHDEGACFDGWWLQ